MGTADAMLERAITVTVVVSSILLLCLWARYTFRLILSGFRKVQQRRQSGGTDLDGLRQMLDLDNAALDRLMNRPDRITKRKGGR